MAKLIIQIPCFNEADHITETVFALPRKINGIDQIEYLVVDDGSDDGTSERARLAGVHHVVRHRGNRGLAAAFQTGVDYALGQGADVIVNTDADGQYAGDDVRLLVEPIVSGAADIVIGDRGVRQNEHFGPMKRLLQRMGSKVVRSLSRTEVIDAVSGFRAMSRKAAQNISITTEFSYTTDMLIQAGRKRLCVVSVSIRTNAATRPSRLFKSIPGFICQTGITIARAYTTYNPLRVFAGAGIILAMLGVVPIARFLWFYLTGNGDGHVQSLVLGVALLLLGSLAIMLGILGDLISSNRKLLEANLRHIRELDERVGALSQLAKVSLPQSTGPESNPERHAG